MNDPSLQHWDIPTICFYYADCKSRALFHCMNANIIVKLRTWCFKRIAFIIHQSIMCTLCVAFGLTDRIRLDWGTTLPHRKTRREHCIILLRCYKGRNNFRLDYQPYSN